MSNLGSFVIAIENKRRLELKEVELSELPWSRVWVGNWSGTGDEGQEG